MSWSDIKNVGYSLGMTEPDNYKSKVYNGSTSATVTTNSGNGMTNNRPFISQAFFFGGSKDINTSTANQFQDCTNNSIQQRQGRYVDTTSGNVNGLYGNSTATICSLSQLKNDFTPTYEI